MNYLSWNCGGLGKTCAILKLTKLVKKYAPTIVFLMETKVRDDVLKRLCSKLQFDNFFIVPRINTGGGLVLYWKNKVDLHVLNSSPTYIDAIVNSGLDDVGDLQDSMETL